MEKILFPVPLLPLVRKTETGDSRVDSLFCGKATPVAARHRRTAKSRLSNPPLQKKNGNP